MESISTTGRGPGIGPSIDDRLKALGIELPSPPPAAGSYEPVMIRRNIGYVSGQLPIRNGVLAFSGRVGDELSIEEATQAAELAALNVLAEIECTTNKCVRSQDS